MKGGSRMLRATSGRVDCTRIPPLRTSSGVRLSSPTASRTLSRASRRLESHRKGSARCVFLASVD